MGLAEKHGTGGWKMAFCRTVHTHDALRSSGTAGSEGRASGKFCASQNGKLGVALKPFTSHERSDKCRCRWIAKLG